MTPLTGLNLITVCGKLRTIYYSRFTIHFLKSLSFSHDSVDNTFIEGVFGRMKQLFLGLATLIIALTAGILITDKFDGESRIQSVETEHHFTATPAPRRDGFRSVCDLTSEPLVTDVSIALKGTLADFESSDTKMIDLKCTSISVSVSCGESDSECKNVLADLKAAEAAMADVIVVGEYFKGPGSGDNPKLGFRIKRFVEVGTVSFATGPDQPYPSIEGARDRPAKKPEPAKNKVNRYTVVGNGKGIGLGSGSGTGEGIKK